jgi:hypothetical protein
VKLTARQVFTAYRISLDHGPELTADQWDAIPGDKPEILHGDSRCNGRQFDGEGHVFFCRGKYGCNRWFCACDGGDNSPADNELCSACWVKYQKLQETFN